MFAHLDNFFRAIDKALCEEACQIIIEVPTFLSLIANVMKKQLQGKFDTCEVNIYTCFIEHVLYFIL